MIERLNREIRRRTRVVVTWRRIRRFYAATVLAPRGLNLLVGYTHYPAPELRTAWLTPKHGAFSYRLSIHRQGSIGSKAWVPLCIVTFGTAQLDEPLSVAAAHHGGNADFA